MAVVNGAATSLVSHLTNGNEPPFNSDAKKENRLRSQLTHNALVSTAKILSRSDPTSGTVTYTLQIGNVQIPSVSAFEIFDYVSPYELEVFENASFKSEIAAQELAAKTRTEELKRGPGRPRREVKTSESDDSSQDARNEDSNGPTTLLGGRRPRPNYTHFYPKQRAKRGGGTRDDDSVQVVIESRNRGGFVRPDMPASNAASSASSRSERQHKRQKRESSSAAESVYSIASLPVQQSSLVKAAGRVTSKEPGSQSPADIDIIEASLDAPPTRPRGSSVAKTAKAKLSESSSSSRDLSTATAKAKVSESPTDLDSIEASLATSSSAQDKGKSKARARVSLSESPMDVDETPVPASSTRKPTESIAKAALSSKTPTGQTTISRWTRDENNSAREVRDRMLARASAFVSKAKAELTSEKPTASTSKAKARLSEASSAPESKAGASSVSKPVSLPSNTAHLTSSTPESRAGTSSVSKSASFFTGTPKPASLTPRAAFEAALKSNTKAKSPQNGISEAASKTTAASSISKAPTLKATVAASSKTPVASSSKSSVAPSSKATVASSSKATLASSAKASVASSSRASMASSSKASVPSSSKASLAASSKATMATSSKAPVASTNSIPASSKPQPTAPSKVITIDSSSSSSSTSSSSDSDSESDGEEAYTVERIITHCLSDPRTHTTHGALPVWLFQVKWQGYDELTWEPVSSFEDEDVLEEYWRGTLNGIRGEKYK